MSGVDPGVDPTQTPGVQSPPEAEGPPAWTTLLPPPLVQADMAELEPDDRTDADRRRNPCHDVWPFLFYGNQRQVNRFGHGGVRHCRLHNLVGWRLP